ncbi:nitrilase [Salipaludibacillus keqinensis]|uniref:Nitrilase n=1 Tax=Salipaludibacillus keqinensis TaxID=2045207 RepID=A0A323TEU6_9BACI|nr:nitrilase-related carbon-nitrogen hydrolase [Salipaludibacillus keqinensis]PYZ93449.1 nitrilase [Salipaludibacillus keqinensis]
MLKVAGIQMNSTLHEKQKNRKKAINLIKQAAKNGAKIICLPELSMTGYHVNKESIPELAEHTDGETVQVFRDLASQLSVVLIVPFLELDSKNTNNYISAAIIDTDGALCGIHRKSMLWGDEKQMFTPGDKTYQVYETSLCKIGVLICYDIEFPEPARSLAVKGAELLFVPSVWSVPAVSRWDIQLPARALDNSLFVFGVNAAGEHTCGKSKLVSAEGEVMIECNGNSEEIIYGDVDLPSLKTTRKKIPYLKDLPADWRRDC